MVLHGRYGRGSRRRHRGDGAKSARPRSGEASGGSSIRLQAQEKAEEKPGKDEARAVVAGTKDLLWAVNGRIGEKRVRGPENLGSTPDPEKKNKVSVCKDTRTHVRTLSQETGAQMSKMQRNKDCLRPPPPSKQRRKPDAPRMAGAPPPHFFFFLSQQKEDRHSLPSFLPSFPSSNLRLMTVRRK